MAEDPVVHVERTTDEPSSTYCGEDGSMVELQDALLASCPACLAVAPLDEIPGQMEIPGMPPSDDPAEVQRRKLAELQEGNAALYQELLTHRARKAKPSRPRPDPLEVLMLRINTLLDLLSPEDKAQFDYVFELQMRIVLTEHVQQIRQEQLLAPDSDFPGPNGGLYIPGT